MAPSIGSAWRYFWHTMTSYDRHASHDSPYRTGQHVALSQSRHAPLTSVATNADESRTNLNTSYDGPDVATPSFAQSTTPHSPGHPYSPGMRTAMQQNQSDDPKSNVSTGEIQMQAFSDGMPPAPPVSHSWKRIDRWAEDNYEELLDNIGDGCTQNDINELEHELDCTLPMEVRESLQVHDGQERGGRPTGIIFSAMLMDCEEIVQEWKNWRRVGEELLNSQPSAETPQVPLKSFAGPSSSADAQPATQTAGNSRWREDLLSRQDSQPSGAIQKVYAHPAWIPLARDWGGNNLAVDLAPGPAGKWGQVILMGRDYDCTYVVARSWSALLATVADDLGTSKVFVNEDTGELKLREFKQQNIEPSYLDILRWRADQKHGRKAPRRRPGPPVEARTTGAAVAAARGSPYSSPVTTDADRGRPSQRLSSKGIATSSPRGGVSSPLARVAEEAPTAPKANNQATANNHAAPDLVSTDTPRGSEERKGKPAANGTIDGPVAAGQNKENLRGAGSTGLGMKNIDLEGRKSAEGEMKTVEV
ncbi:MAG: Cell wall assembly regulator [Alyxoria varia]|nr:MAG: Cell wall assembly regulator [Alyxoria varia]